MGSNKKSRVRVYTWLYGAYKPGFLRLLLEEEGGILLLNAGKYDQEKLGLPGIVKHSLEVIGINATRDQVVLSNTSTNDWGITVGGDPGSQKADPAYAMEVLEGRCPFSQSKPFLVTLQAETKIFNRGICSA